MMSILSGCSLRGTRSGSGTETAAVIQELRSGNAGLTTLRAEAEAAVSFAGRRIALPSALVVRRGLFRIDLLDPLDRPAAILFAREGRLVQYRPAAALAAAIDPLPNSCTELAVEFWLEPVLAGGSEYPVKGAAGESYRGRKNLLERYRLDELVEEIRFEQRGGQTIPRKVTRYCGESPAMKVVLDDYRSVGRFLIPHLIEVSFPAAGLTMELRLRGVEANPAVEESTFSPVLPPGTTWKKWRAVHEPL